MASETAATCPSLRSSTPSSFRSRKRSRPSAPGRPPSAVDVVGAARGGGARARGRARGCGTSARAPRARTVRDRQKRGECARHLVSAACEECSQPREALEAAHPCFWSRSVSLLSRRNNVAPRRTAAPRDARHGVRTHSVRRLPRPDGVQQVPSRGRPLLPTRTVSGSTSQGSVAEDIRAPRPARRDDRRRVRRPVGRPRPRHAQAVHGAEFACAPRGAYDADDDAFLAIGDELAARVAHAKFADWVFVSGSIIGAVPSAARARPGGVQLYDTFNFVIVQRGANATERVTHFKRYISSIGERARESGETCDDPLRSERETPRTRLPPPLRNPPLASARRARGRGAQTSSPRSPTSPPRWSTRT